MNNVNVVSTTEDKINLFFKHLSVFSKKTNLRSEYMNVIKNEKLEVVNRYNKLLFNTLFNQIKSGKYDTTIVINPKNIITLTNNIAKEYVERKPLDYTILMKLCNYNIQHINILVDVIKNDSSKDIDDICNLLVMTIVYSIRNLYIDLFNVDILFDFSDNNMHHHDEIENDEMLLLFEQFSEFLSRVFHDKIKELNTYLKEEDLDKHFEDLKKKKKNRINDFLNSFNDPETKFAVKELQKTFQINFDKHALYNTEYVNNNNMNQDIGGNMEGEYNEELDFTNIIGNNDENGENEMD